MRLLGPKLAKDGSILVVIRPHVRNGQISDYVLRTRLALRDAGWIECEEIIWVKRDAPPLGSILRPRRCWESILWFSRSRSPYVDLKALGNKVSDRIGGFFGSNRLGTGNDMPVHEGQRAAKKTGASRSPDVICADVGAMSQGIPHPAMYPGLLAQQLVLMFSRKGDLVLDPFCGSGTTCIEAVKMGRRGLGIEVSPKYARIAEARMIETNMCFLNPDD
jgi:DNA modification methylase